MSDNKKKRNGGEYSTNANTIKNNKRRKGLEGEDEKLFKDKNATNKVSLS